MKMPSNDVPKVSSPGTCHGSHTADMVGVAYRIGYNLSKAWYGYQR